ncbi:hypothetical protein IGI04_013077 [Brassica rapa subsp. trilocularis]|uniref:Uncharacterized protein n=1 Tax=Brassica rapa subsp. trilocularis TaxID=1813537 RepID=A0ABQ7N7U9_BRACM|nr:hypothetical protein IGI04_013077 [Brassica rapa subsp. trilocularis]
MHGKQQLRENYKGKYLLKHCKRFCTFFKSCINTALNDISTFSNIFDTENKVRNPILAFQHENNTSVYINRQVGARGEEDFFPVARAS